MLDLKFRIHINLYCLVAVSMTCLLLFSCQTSGESFEAGSSALARGHHATAMRAWKGMAESGVAEAQNNVGHLYEKGLGVSQDYSQAKDWYKKAADQRLPEAQHNLGMLYYHGYGVGQDYRAARKWFNRATKNEIYPSQYMLGLLYYKGEGVTKDLALARQHFKTAAENNYGNAQMMYAYMLQAGDGGEADPKRALTWASIAESREIDGAKEISYYAELLLNDLEISTARQSATACIIAEDFTKCIRGNNSQ